MPESLINNIEARRFERVENGSVAHADYTLEGDILTLRFVFAPPALRGTGAAGRLMADIVALSSEQGWRIVPVCGYAAAWLRKHPEHAPLLA